MNSRDVPGYAGHLKKNNICESIPWIYVSLYAKFSIVPTLQRGFVKELTLETYVIPHNKAKSFKCFFTASSGFLNTP